MNRPLNEKHLWRMEQFAGKTIKEMDFIEGGCISEVGEPDRYGGYLLITFEGGEYAIVNTYRECNSILEINDPKYAFEDECTKLIYHPEVFIKTGLMTEEKYEENKEKHLSKIRQEQKEREERIERAKYEQLKEKYGA